VRGLRVAWHTANLLDLAQRSSCAAWLSIGSRALAPRHSCAAFLLLRTLL